MFRLGALASFTTLALVAACGAPASRASDGSASATQSTNPASGASDPGGIDAVLSEIGYVKTVGLSYVHQAQSGFAPDADGTCPLSSLSGSPSTYAAIVARNTSGQAAFLEANADCSSGDGASIAVYVGATSAPANASEQMACSGHVASGAAGPGALTSTESNGSRWCPGVTLANGAAVPLAPGDTAVIVVSRKQGSESGPPTLDLDLASSQ